MNRQIAALIAGLGLSLCVTGAHAQAATELVCPEESETLNRFRYLRALSLDLRGTLPTTEEIELLKTLDAVPERLIDEWLDSDAFAQQAVKRHRALLWNNIESTPLLSVNSNLQLLRPAGIYWRRNLSRNYRGDIVPCADEPARFSPDGRILTRVEGDARVEGWVEVAPYWAPDTTIKVCAFDAQTHAVTLSGVACGSNGSFSETECGCGEDLRWCTTGQMHRVVNRGMGEAIDRLIHDLIREDRPYTELFSSRWAYINGPMAYFYRHHLKLGRGFIMEPSPIPMELVPDLPFTAVDEWVRIELPETHAGVLTRPAFLLRFQTNRARANRFFNAFLCQPFQPPSAGLPVGGEPTPDIQLRDGCKYCHALLEPAGAHWGRWAERGIAYLSPERFPREREDCLNCALRGQSCSLECRQQYITKANSPEEEIYLGQLNGYFFRRPEHERYVEQGPKLMAFSAFTDDRLPKCAAKNAAQWLLGRDLDAEGDAEWITTLGAELVTGGYSYRNLVKSIVTSPRYRRVR